jgi:photosystem II stability/assembly factor-like uncharacterized protein
MVAVAAVILSGCIGSGGSSASAPTDVKAFPRDSRVIVTWTMEPGVEYWIYHANGSGVTPENCSSMPLCGTAINVTSPASITGLTNDLPYSFSINGRRDGGAGGPGSAAEPATPRLAGATWTAPLTNPIPNTTAMRGVTYGVTSAAVATYVAVGDSGALYSGTVYTVPSSLTAVDTGITWTPLTTTTTFNAVSYDAYGTKYLVAGNGGAILQSTDAVTWTPQTSTTTKTGNNLYAVANNGANTFVATGAAGTIITSLDGGASWTVQTYSGSPALNGVAYGYVTSLAGARFMAVGASGTVLLSVDGVSWTPATSLPSPISTSEVKGVTYGTVAGYGTFVVVTADGYATRILNDGTWATPVHVSTSSLNAVTASLNAAVPMSTTVTTTTNAFVAVDSAGKIWRSKDGGATWTNPYSVSGSTPLYAVTHGGLFDYVVVGAGGVNLYAD